MWRLTERRKRALGNRLGGVSNSNVFDETYDEANENDGTDRASHLQRVHNAGDLRIPLYEYEPNGDSSMTVEALPRRNYDKAHAYHINSISVNSDQETFLSADDLRINLWNLQVTNQSFSILCLSYLIWNMVWLIFI